MKPRRARRPRSVGGGSRSSRPDAKPQRTAKRDQPRGARGSRGGCGVIGGIEKRCPGSRQTPPGVAPHPSLRGAHTAFCAATKQSPDRQGETSKKISSGATFKRRALSELVGAGQPADSDVRPDLHPQAPIMPSVCVWHPRLGRRSCCGLHMVRRKPSPL
jgi:hypothetical protein